MTAASRRSGTGSPTGQAAHSDDTRGRVLAVARRLFLERGYSGTTTGAIADAVGIKAPALYWYFASKEELLYATIAEDLDRFIGTVVPASENGDPAEALASFVRRYVLFQLDWQEDGIAFSSMARVAEVKHVLTGSHLQHLVDLQRVVLDSARAVVTAGVRRGQFQVGDATVTAFALISMCEQVVNWARPDGRLDADQIADELVDIAHRIVSTSTPPRTAEKR